jgi:hypothetical protein
MSGDPLFLSSRFAHWCDEHEPLDHERLQAPHSILSTEAEALVATIVQRLT